MGAREVGKGTSGLGENPEFGVKVGSEESVLLTPGLGGNSQVGMEDGVR